MRERSGGRDPRRAVLIAVGVACALWLPVQNLLLLAVALGGGMELERVFTAARELALPLLLVVTAAWMVVIVLVLAAGAVWRRRAMWAEGGRS